MGNQVALYESKWLGTKRKQIQATERSAVVAACKICNELGYLEFLEGAVGECPHDADKLAQIHQHKPIRGFQPN